MPQLKACKGPECEVKKPRGEMLGPMNEFCSTDCGFALSRERQNKAREKARRKVRAYTAKRDKASKKAVRDLDRQDIQWQHRQTKKVFNRMRVLEELKWFADQGKEPECISCGKKNMDWCCGHYQTVGANGRLRYDRLNTYLQCNRYCNMGLSGNISGNKTTRGYESGLVERFGADQAQSIMDYCKTNNAPMDWVWQDMEKQRAGFAKKLRELESSL